MRKNVWKRFLAAALAAVVMFTSVDCTGLVVNAEGTTKTLGEVVTEHYGISGDELAVLTHTDLTANAKTYDVAAPADLDTKVKLDVANKTITADSYTKADGVTWTPSKVVVVFTGSEEEAVADAGVYTYEGEDTVKEVKVTYEASVEVSADEQLELLNTTYYLAVATQNMDFYLTDPDLEGYADTIQNHAVPNLSAAVSLFDTIKEDEQIKAAVEQGQITLPADEAISALEGHIDTVDEFFELADLYDAYEGADQVVYWAKYVSTLIGSFEDTQDAIEALATSDALVELADLLVDAGTLLGNEDAVKAGNAINDSYIPAFENYLANETVQEFDEEYLYASKKDLLVDEPAGGFSLPDRNLQKYQYDSGDVDATTLSVGEPTEVTVEATNRVATVKVSATVIEDNTEVVKTAKEVEVVVGLGNTLDEVKAAINDKVVAAIEEIDPNGTYGLVEYTDVYNLNNYDCTVEAGDIEANGVTDNATISITYAPKTYTVTCTESGNSVDITEGKETLPYGYVLTLPNATEGGQSYEYVADGEVYEQGTEYTVTGDVAFTRSQDKAKTSIRVNEIAVEDYADALTDDAETILKSYAVESDSISARVPDNTWISITDNTLNVADYNAGNGFTWTPSKILVKSGSTVVDTITDIQDGKVTISATNYDTVDVEYTLEVTDVDIEDIVNTPYELYQSVQKQLSDLKALAGYEGGLSQINRSILEMLATQLNDDSKAAIATVIEEGCNQDNTGALILYTHVLNYKDLSDAAKVNYYYTNYDEIKAQINMLADQLAIIAEDEGLETLKSNPTFASYAEYIDLIPEYADKLGDMKTSYFAAKSEKLLTDATGYDTLMDVLVSSSTDVAEVTEINGLYWTKVLNADAPEKASVIVSMQILNSDGNVTASTAESDGKVTFDIETGLTDEQLAEVNSKYAAFVASLDVDTLHYELKGGAPTYSGEEPYKGMTTGTTVTYTWVPKYYTVNLEGVTDEAYATQKFPYDKKTITLPAAEEGARHYYDINGTEVVVEQEDVSCSLNDSFTALFDNANVTEITISRRAVVADVEDQNKEAGKLVDNLGSVFESAGLTDSTGELTTKPIQYNDKETELPETLVVRIEDNGSEDGGIVNSIAGTVGALVLNYSYVEIGGEKVVYSENGAKVISLQAAINALLGSGIGTESIDNMFDAEGNTNENVKLEDGLVAANDGIATMRLSRTSTSLGAEIINTILKVGADEETAIELDFVISFIDENVTSDDKAKREELKATLKTLRQYVEITGKEGNLTVEVKEPLSKEVYEMYLLTMVLEGETDLKSVNDVTLTDIAEHEYERFVTDLNDDTITIETLENTLTKFGQDVDLNSNENVAKVINKLLELHKKDGNLEEMKVAMNDEANKTAGAEETYFSTEVLTEYVLNAMKELGVSEADLETIKQSILESEIDTEQDGYLDVPIKLVVDGIDSDEPTGDYAAAIINDPKALEGINGANGTSAKIAANAINLVTATELSTTPVEANAMVIMLTDADTVTFNGNAILDLNGNNVNTVNSTAGTVVLVDSTYDNAGDAVSVNGTVKDARIDKNDAETDNFYTITVDADGNLTVGLDAAFLANAAAIETPELKVLACELAFDLIMNNITSGDMVVTGTNGEYDLYDVDVTDDIFEFISNDKATIVNKLIDIVNLGVDEENGTDTAGLIEFVNDILATLTKFADLAKAAKDGSVITSYSVITNPLNVNLAVAAGNYITAGITTDSDNAKNFKVDFVVSGKDDDKTALAELCNKLAEVVKVCDLSIDLDDISFVNGNVAARGQAANAEVVVDLTGDKNYAVALGAILANGMEAGEAKDALVAAVKDYLTEGDQDSMLALKKAMESATTAQVIKAIKAAYANYDAGKDFDAILASLGITEETEAVKALEGVYEDLLNVIYRVATLVSNKLGIDGDSRTLGGIAYKLTVEGETVYAYGGSVDRTVKSVDVDATLELRLFKDIKDTGVDTEDPKPPVNPEQPNKPNKPDDDGDYDDKDSDSNKPVEVHPAPSTTTATSSTGTSTGDTNNTMLWISVMGLAVVAVVAVLVIKKRKAAK